MNQSPKIFYLVRHALATHSKYGYGRKKFTASILSEGMPAIQRLAVSLKDVHNSINVSSEIVRCKETSALISQITSKKFTFDKRLDENKNGETIGEIRKRVRDFLRDIYNLPQTNIIICTHGVIIAAIKNLLVYDKFVTKQLHDFPLTGELMIIEGKTVKTINFN